MVVSSTLVPLWLAPRLLLPSLQDTSNNVMVDISTSPRPSRSPFSVVWALWNVKVPRVSSIYRLHQRRVRQQSQQHYQRTQHSRLISNQLGPDWVSTCTTTGFSTCVNYQIRRQTPDHPTPTKYKKWSTYTAASHLPWKYRSLPTERCYISWQLGRHTNRISLV